MRTLRNREKNILSYDLFTLMIATLLPQMGINNTQYNHNNNNNNMYLPRYMNTLLAIRFCCLLEITLNNNHEEARATVTIEELFFLLLKY